MIKSTDQAQRTRKIIDPSESRTRLCCRKGTAAVSQNTIPRTTKTDSQIEYDMHTGEPNSI